MSKIPIRKIQILIVEDESIVAMDIESCLLKLGYIIPIIANTGEEAVAAAEKFLPDLILMDIQLKGGMDGTKAAEKIRKLFNIPIIYLTAYADEETLRRAKATEPYGYILKPFKEIELHTAIDVVIKKHETFLLKENILERKLQISEEHFRLFVEAIKDYAIYILDLDGNLMSWNIGAARITGHAIDEVLGKNFSLLFTDEDLALKKPQELLRNALVFGRYNVEGWRKRKDGTKYFANVISTAIYDKNGKHINYGIVLHDLTLTKEKEEAFKKAITSRDTFLSIASHELKTPLTLLQLQAQVLDRNIKKEPEKQVVMDTIVKFLDVVIKQVKKLTLLVDDMLDVSRIQTGKLVLRMELVNLKQLIDEVLNAAKEFFIAGSTPVPQFSSSKENILVNLDRIRIEQVINNIFTNAIRYAKGSSVSVKLREIKEGVLIEVADNGPGISKENLIKIFEKFERAMDYSKTGGLGLGLFIANKIIEGHGGKMWATSELGKGTTFYIQLPLK